jgi:hypothetical protein
MVHALDDSNSVRRGFHSTGAAEDGRAPTEELSCIRSGNLYPMSGRFWLLLGPLARFLTAPLSYRREF